jgi:serine phosphatase RsbU (regulator of sigma subunit)
VPVQPSGQPNLGDARPSPSHPPTALMRPWRTALLGVVLVTGAGATLTSWNQSEDDADGRQRALTTEVAVLVEGTADATVAAVAGGSGLVSREGTIDRDAFGTYAREVVDVSPVESLAFVAVVSGDGRAEFEAKIGRPIADRRDGDLVPASERPLYYPVRAVFPETEALQGVIGFDILADPVRGAAAVEARDSGRTVLTEPVRATSDGEVSYFLVKPLYRTGATVEAPDDRRAAHAGFLTTVYAGENFTEAILDNLPEGSRFSLMDGEVLLATSDPGPTGGSHRMLDAQGRDWELVIEDGRGADRSPVWALAAFTALLEGGLLLFFRRTEVHDSAARRSALVIARTADVAQALAAAATVEEVDAVIVDQIPSVLGAKAASLGAVDRVRGVLRLGRSTGANPGVVDTSPEVRLDQRRPVTEVVRLGEPVLLRTIDDWRDHAPEELVAEAIRTGLVSTACLPLEDRDGEVAATLTLSWDHAIDFDATTVDTLRTLAELCEYTLDRARTTDRAAHEATELARLAGQLAATATVAEVLDIIVESGPTPVHASATSVGLVDREAGILRTHHGPQVSDEVRRRFADPPLEARLAFTDAARTGEPVLLEDHDAFAARYPRSADETSTLGFGARAALPIRGSDGEVIGSIVHAWEGPRRFDQTLVSTLLTIAEMAGQALERTGLSEAEHRLVTTLQDSLLVPLPDAQHLDVATRYLPATHHVGMGGDWYEGIPLDEHRYALIIGDVAGHGITAVGDMAQLRAVLGALVRLGTPLKYVFGQTTNLMQAAAQSSTASALLVVIDTKAATVSYATAGHPPPMVRPPSGPSQVLDEGRQPILGVPVEDGTASVAPFPPGSVLVAYTDGLVERRGESLDVSLDRLRGFLDAATDTQADALATELVRASLGDAEPDDDVALVVIGHRPV